MDKAKETMIEAIERQGSLTVEEMDHFQKGFVAQYGDYMAVLEKMKNYEDALRKIDNHIRSTPEPVPYIIKELKTSLPEYSDYD